MAVLTDPISDFLTRFKNAARAGNEEFSAPYSKIKADIARILQEEGYLWNYEVVTGERTTLKAKPKFIDGRAVLTDLKRVIWQGTDHWDTLLPERAAISGRLVLSDFTRDAIRQFKAR